MRSSVFLWKAVKKLDRIQKKELGRKIGIAYYSVRVNERCMKHTRFYRKYAAIVYRTLSKPLFQSFLAWMLTKESIEGNMISKIQVIIFPYRNEKGNWLLGRISRKGEIYIFPKKKGSCKRLRHEFEMDNVQFYIKARAMAALIHEFLHLRYATDESIVRQKTERYFRIFIRKGYATDSKSYPILEQLFTT